MAGDTDNPRIWAGADVYVADIGTTAPTTTTGSLAAGWKALGLLHEDGLTESRSEDSTDHHAWGGILVRTTRSKHKRTFQVAALEDNDEVWRLVNPGSYAEGGAQTTTTRHVLTPTTDPKAFLFEMTDGTITKRIIVPRGEVTTVGDIVASDDELTAYELTITVYPDADGALYLELTDDPSAEPSGS